MASRGSKTKGNKYKYRYVDKECPECGNLDAYRDKMHTRISFVCLKRDCRFRWYEPIGGLDPSHPNYRPPVVRKEPKKKSKKEE